MENYRYGRFRPGDYCESWAAITVYLIFSITSFALELSCFFVAFPLVCAIVRLCVILAHHREKFIICDNSIVVMRGKKTQTIVLPSELTLVVSYADVCPPLTMRTAYSKGTHILRGKYAITILQKMPLEVIIAALHRVQIRDYTTSVVRGVFDDYHYIYSFVCNQSHIDRLIEGRYYLLVIPESLREKVSLSQSVSNVYVDPGH